METSDYILSALKWIIIAVFCIAGYEWYSGDHTISHKAVALLEKSGMKGHIDDMSRKTASTFNKVVGEDLKKANPKAVVNKVQDQLKGIQDAQKKKEQDLLHIEDR